MTHRWWPLGLFVVGFIAVGMFFRTHPEIDIAVSHYFFSPMIKTFSNDMFGPYIIVKRSIYVFDDIWVLVLLAGIAVGYLPIARVQPAWRKFRIHRAQCLFLLLVLAIGPGLIVTLSKEFHPRPRPIESQPFLGKKPFVPALTLNSVEGNSSLSGHAATGYSLVALAYIDHRRRRRLYAAGLVAGSAIAFTRIALGGHYLSDILITLMVILFITHLIACVFERVRRKHGCDLPDFLSRGV